MRSIPNSMERNARDAGPVDAWTAFLGNPEQVYKKTDISARLSLRQEAKPIFAPSFQCYRENGRCSWHQGLPHPPLYWCCHERLETECSKVGLTVLLPDVLRPWRVCNQDIAVFRRSVACRIEF